MKFQNIKTIYFDYDGTIHDSIKIYAPAFRKSYDFLVENKKAEPKEWTDDEIKKWLGYTSKEMWKNFMVDLDEQIKVEASSIIGKEMENQIFSGNARLYNDALDVLDILKNRGYKLVFLSNCSINYMEVSNRLFNLKSYFHDMICSEMYDFIPKHEILKKIKNNYGMNQVIIGDRFHDIESAEKNNIESVFCEYGYGDIEEGIKATVTIKDIKEILWYLDDN